MRNREIVAGVAQGTYSRNAEVESVALSQTASSKEIQWLLGFWAGHQVGFDEGLTHASKGAYLDRQDHRVELFDAVE